MDYSKSQWGYLIHAPNAPWSIPCARTMLPRDNKFTCASEEENVAPVIKHGFGAGGRRADSRTRL